MYLSCYRTLVGRSTDGLPPSSVCIVMSVWETINLVYRETSNDGLCESTISGNIRMSEVRQDRGLLTSLGSLCSHASFAHSCIHVVEGLMFLARTASNIRYATFITSLTGPRVVNWTCNCFSFVLDVWPREYPSTKHNLLTAFVSIQITSYGIDQMRCFTGRQKVPRSCEVA